MTIKFDEKCEYLQEKGCSSEATQYVLDLITYCRKIRPFLHYYREQITSFNHTAHNILKNKIDLILLQFPTVRKEKRGIIASLISGFIGLAYEAISSFLHNRIHKALHKAVKAMETKENIQHNKCMHLEDSMVMHGVYNAETLEKLINTVHKMHNSNTLNESIFRGEINMAFMWYVNKQGAQHYAINLLLYLRMLR